MTHQDTVQETQNRVLDVVREGQEAWVKGAQAWSDTVVRLVPSYSQVPGLEQFASPAELVDSGFEFAERLLATQRRFAREFFGATEPALRVVEDRATAGVRHARSAAK